MKVKKRKRNSKKLLLKITGIEEIARTLAK